MATFRQNVKGGVAHLRVNAALVSRVEAITNRNRFLADLRSQKLRNYPYTIREKKGQVGVGANSACVPEVQAAPRIG